MNACCLHHPQHESEPDNARQPVTDSDFRVLTRTGADESRVPAAIVLAMDHTIASEDTSGTLSGDSRTFCSMLILRNIMETRKS